MCFDFYLIAISSESHRALPLIARPRSRAHAATIVVVFGFWSDRVKRRAPFVLCGQLLCLAGFAINISSAPIGAKYFGTFLVVTGGYSAYPAMTAWYAAHAQVI